MIVVAGVDKQGKNEPGERASGAYSEFEKVVLEYTAQLIASTFPEAETVDRLPREAQ